MCCLHTLFPRFMLTFELCTYLTDKYERPITVSYSIILMFWSWAYVYIKRDWWGFENCCSLQKQVILFIKHKSQIAQNNYKNNNKPTLHALFPLLLSLYLCNIYFKNYNSSWPKIGQNTVFFLFISYLYIIHLMVTIKYIHKTQMGSVFIAICKWVCFNTLCTWHSLYLIIYTVNTGICFLKISKLICAILPSLPYANVPPNNLMFLLGLYRPVHKM